MTTTSEKILSEMERMGKIRKKDLCALMLRELSIMLLMELR